MAVSFDNVPEGCALVITGRGGDELHRSVHKNKKKAVQNLARIRGALRELPPSAKFSARMRTDGFDELNDAIDEHQASYALIECREVLEKAPQTDLVKRADAAISELLAEALSDDD